MTDDEIGWTEALGPHADNPPAPRASGESIYVVRCPSCDDFRDPQVQDETGKFPSSQCSCGADRVVERYKVPDDEQGIKAQFEQWVRDGAQQAIQETMMSGDLEEADRLRDKYMSQRREYTWDGKHCRAMRASWTGIIYLAYLLLRRCHPQMTEERASKIVHANPKGWGMVWAWAQGNWEALARQKARAAQARAAKNGRQTESTAAGT